jgi:hypothetical protein
MSKQTFLDFDETLLTGPTTRMNRPATPGAHVSFAQTEKTFGSADNEKLHKTRPKSVVNGTRSV